MEKLRTETLCIQAGYTPGNGEPRQIPIVQSTTFKYATSEDMGKLFDLEAEGYFYSRLANPTCDAVAAKICALEGGSAAMLTSSGQAANFMAVFNIAGCGDHIVASSAIYGGSFNLFAVTMKKMGLETTFIDPDCTEEELNSAFRPNTKAVFGETIANPALTVLDIEKFAKAAHAHGVPLIVDNTFATPINCQPIAWGADIVTHSTTKYMDGHASCVGGCIVDGGKFDWNAYAEKFPGLTTPESPSVILRNTEGIDGETTVLPFLKVGAMEVAINGTKLISGTKDNKKITAANYADGSSFSMNLGDNLPSSKLIDIIRAYYESRGAEVNIRKGGGMVINPFANCLTSSTRSNSGTTVVLSLKSSDNFTGESYFFSCVASSVAADYVRLTFFKADGTNEQVKRYIDNEYSYGGFINCRISFKTAQHQYTQIAVSFEGYSSNSVAAAATFENVMLSRSDVLTPYTADPAETKEQLTMLEEMGVAVSYPFATAIAGKPVFWRSWKLGGYNSPAKTVTAGYSSGMTDPVMSVTKNSVGGIDSSAINVGINGKATTGRYLDEKGAPLSGLFFSSRKDLQTSAGFLAKWLFAACARKLTVTQPRGGSFGEVMEEQGDNSTNYYMFAPPAQPLNGYTIALPAVATSRALTTWLETLAAFKFDSSLFDISFSLHSFLGFNTLIINLREVKPANDMAAFAAEDPTAAETWFTFKTTGSYAQAPHISAAYLNYLKSHTYTSGYSELTILGFTRLRYEYKNTNMTAAGVMGERVELRKDAPCRFVEVWLKPPLIEDNAPKAFINVSFNGRNYRYAAYDKNIRRAIVYIIAFSRNVSAPTSKKYGNLTIVSFPDNVASLEISYYTQIAMPLIPYLYYYQLNQN